MKAKAYLDLLKESKSGVHIDERDIRKHRNDIIRLYQLLPSSTSIVLPKTIRQDMQDFLSQIEGCFSINLKDLGLKNIKLSEVVNTLKNAYCSFEN